MADADSRLDLLETSKSRSSKVNLVFAFLSLLVCATIPLYAVVGSLAAFGKISDFPEFYTSMRMVREGQSNGIYKLSELFKNEQRLFPALGQRRIAFYIPPFSAILLAPIGTLAPQPAYLVFMAAAFSSLVGAVVLLGKKFKLGLLGTVWLSSLIFIAGPTFESLRISQLAPFLFLAQSLFLFFAERRRDIAAALSLSILLLKPQELLPMAIYLLFAGRFKIIITMSIIISILVIASFFIFGQAGYANYFDLLKDSAANLQFMQPELSATLRGQLLRLGFQPNSANALSAFVLVAALGTISFVAFKFGRQSSFVETGLLRFALPLGLITALHCHDYDLLLLTPWVLSTYRNRKDETIPSEGQSNRPEEQSGKSATNSGLTRAAEISLCVLVASLSVPFYVPIHYDWLMKEHQVLNPLFLFYAAACLISMTQIMRQTK